MKTVTIRKAATVFTLLTAMLFTGTVDAQKATFVEIRGGDVFINGETVPRSTFPQSFDASDVNMSFSFFGETTPVVELNRKFYIIANGRLREASETEITSTAVNVFVTSAELHQETLRGAYKRELADLYEKAKVLNQYKERAPAANTEEVARLLEEAQQSAEQVVVMASQLPRVDMQGYWNVVKDQNNDLYTLFNQEWDMEMRAQQMAQRARLLQDGPEREALISELTDTLERIFVLKQENRKKEIVELQLQLEALERNMRDRTQYKDEIIQRRLKDLLGQQ